MSKTIKIVIFNPSSVQTAEDVTYLKALGYSQIEIICNPDHPFKGDCDLILYTLPNGPGADALGPLQNIIRNTNAPVIITSPPPSHRVIIDIMRIGAADFLLRPFSLDSLKTSVEAALSTINTQSPTSQHNANEGDFVFIGQSKAMQNVFQQIKCAAKSNAAVFITGETGTGKELCAHSIHIQSSRHSRRFVALNCAAIPMHLLESEVFGHQRGSFTGALSDRDGMAKLADGGTFFLDEVGEMALPLQSKLLRFLQTGCIQPIGSGQEIQTNVRIISATHQNPQSCVKNGNLREDLFYRLHVLPIHMPALRDRGDDITLLAEHLVKIFSCAEGHAEKRLEDSALDKIQSHSWPGNIRELQNIIRHTIVMNESDTISADMINIRQQSNPPPAIPPYRTKPLSVVERDTIERAIKSCGGNITKAAAILDVNPSTIYRKLQSWGVKTLH